MKYSRQELLKALNIVKPALAQKEIILETTHFWFLGKTILAYDDTIGIEVPFETDFTGGIQGKLIIGLLEKSAAKEVDISPGKKPSEMVLKAGNARITLALLDEERAIWSFPKFRAKKAFAIDKEFVDLLSNLMISVGQNTAIPDQLGVTFEPYLYDDYTPGDPEWLDLYTTDDATISWARIEKPENYDADRCVITQEFCRQLIALTKKEGQMVVEDDCAMAIVDDGVKLYGRLVDVNRPVDFESKVQEAIPEPEKLVPIPSRLRMALERLGVVIEHIPGAAAEIAIDGEGAMRLYAKADRGEIRDTLRLEGEHEEAVCWLDPVLIRRGVDGRKEMFLSQDAMVMRGPDNYYYLIGASSGRR